MRRVDIGSRPSGVRRAICVCWDIVGCSRTRGSGRDGAASGEYCGTCGCRDCGPALVCRCELRAIGACDVLVLDLQRGSCDVPFTIRRQFDGRRPRINSASAAIVADPVNVGIVVDHGCAIGVVDVRDIYVVHAGVVEKAIVIPASAFVAETAVTEAVIHAAIKADVFTPVSAAPNVSAASPTPVPRSPQISNPRRYDPGSGNPVVVFVIIVVGPVAGSPNVAIPGADRLLVNRKWWWSKTDRNTEADLSGRDGRGGRNRHRNEREQQQTNEVFISHSVPQRTYEANSCSTRTALAVKSVQSWV